MNAHEVTRAGVRRRRWSSATAVALLGGAALLGSAAPAAAVDGGVQLSLDGAHWSSRLPGPLFAGATRVVPGDVVDTTLWVRNGSTVTARLSIRAAEGVGTGTDDLAGNLTLRVDGAPVAGGATWQGGVLAPGEQAAIPLVVTFDAGATSGMLGVSNVLDTVLLTADVPTEDVPTGDVPTATGTSPGATGGATRAGRLAATGTEVGTVAGAAVAAIAVGVLLVRRRRREDDPESATGG